MEKGAPLGLPRLCVLWTAVLWEVCRCGAHANWMWLGIASFGVPEKLGCGNLPLNGHQKDLCKKKPYLLHSIREGARLGIRECQSQFRHERWNCLLSPDTVPALSTNPSSISASPAFSIFGYELSSGTKETAFIYAVMAAGLVHSVTHSCSTGNLTDCACDSMLQNSGSAREGWHWGGCSDDIQYGMWLSRKFLDGPTKNISRKDRNGLMVMNLHNNEAGRLAVAKLMSINCRCHGVSGSCALKTCWRTMSSFAKVGSFLKEKYENSIQISDRLRRKIRRKEKSQRNIPIHKEDLLYINRSPNYCMEDRKLGVSGTQGRECNRTSAGLDGCNLLCCGRGYNTQVVRHVERCSPQGCILSPLLFTLLTHDYCARFATNHIVKFADDTTVVGFIHDDNEGAYCKEVEGLVNWCKENSLVLNTGKTKEIIVDFRKGRQSHTSLCINDSPVEMGTSIKFLGVQFTSRLAWSFSSETLVKRAQQHLHFLHRMRKAHLPSPILTTFYRGTIESILSYSITVWFRSITASDKKAVQRALRT